MDRPICDSYFVSLPSKRTSPSKRWWGVMMIVMIIGCKLQNASTIWRGSFCGSFLVLLKERELVSDTKQLITWPQTARPVFTIPHCQQTLACSTDCYPDEWSIHVTESSNYRSINVVHHYEFNKRTVCEIDCYLHPVLRRIQGGGREGTCSWSQPATSQRDATES